MSPAQDDDPQARRLGELLRHLADDPEAPPSTVTPLSVIAAAKRTAAAAPETAAQRAHQSETTRQPATAPTAPPDSWQAAAASTSPNSAKTSPTTASPPWYRRTRLLTVAAAAAGVVAIGAIALPFVVPSGPDTAGSSPQTAVSAPAQTGPEQRDAADSGGAAEIQPAPGAAPGGEAGEGGDAAAGTASSAAPNLAEGTADPLCEWPILPDDVVAQAVTAVPRGGFAGSGVADGPCAAEIVGAVTLVEQAGTETLVVRVSRTPPAACTLDAPPTAGLCELAPDGSYRTARAADGAQAVFLYGDGYQVEVGLGSGGLTGDELTAVAGAVLDAVR